MTKQPILKIDVAPIPRLALRLAEAAEAIGVSDKTLSGWIKSGDGPPHVRRNGVLMFPVDGLRTWLMQQAAQRSGAGRESHG